MKYHILLVEGCVVSIKSFKTLKARKTFIYNFLLNNQRNEDYGIDLIFEGGISYACYEMERK